MSVTQEQLEQAGPKSTFRDSTGDKWIKRDDVWDYELAKPDTSFYGWTSNRLWATYGDDVDAEILHVVDPDPEDQAFTLKQIRETLVELIGINTADMVARALTAPPPKKQTMVIEIKLDVEGLDPMGDTWDDAKRSVLGPLGIDLEGINTKVERHLNGRISIEIKDRA